MDCVLQLAHQSLAHRLARYFNTQSMWPVDLGAEAKELFPESHKAGPCLLLLRAVAAPPTVLNAWLLASGLDWAVTRVYWLAAGRVADSREELASQLAAEGLPQGPWRLQCFPRSREEGLADHLLDQGWELHPVGFDRVLSVVELPWGEGSRPQLRYGILPAASFFRTPCSRLSRIPHEVSKAAGKLAEALMVADRLGIGGAPAPSALLMPSAQPAAGCEQDTGSCCVGENASRDAHSSRALGAAIDVGAAPGSWTSLLAQRAQRVIAIDPAELDPRVLGALGAGAGAAEHSGPAGGPPEGAAAGTAPSADAGANAGGPGAAAPGGPCPTLAHDFPCHHHRGRGQGEIVHLQCKVAEAVDQVGALLEPCGGQADALVCDMNQHPEATAPMLRALAPHVRPGALLVLTLKFFGSGLDKGEWQRRMEEQLAPEWEDVRMVWLLANTLNERTCLAVRSGGGSGGRGSGKRGSSLAGPGGA